MLKKLVIPKNKLDILTQTNKSNNHNTNHLMYNNTFFFLFSRKSHFAVDSFPDNTGMIYVHSLSIMLCKLMNRGCNQPLTVRNLKFATYLKFATCENTNKINELW